MGEMADDPLAMYLVDLYTVSANLAGIPGLCLPCGQSKSGLPIGLQLQAPRWKKSGCCAARDVRTGDRLAQATSTTLESRTCNRDHKGHEEARLSRKHRIRISSSCSPCLRGSIKLRSMSEPYTTVIGLEVHVQLATASKLFCGCSTRFGAEPNTQTCPVCIGMPGTLPVMNREAFRLSLRDGRGARLRDSGVHQVGPQAVLLSRPAEELSDQPVRSADVAARLPGHQRSEGASSSRSGSASCRAHLEEDAGKSLHDEVAGKADSLIDLNRTGTPLLEIVTRAGHAELGRGEGVSQRAEVAAHVHRRVGLQHAGGQPAGGRECEPAHRHAAGQGRHADRRNQEHEQLPRGRAGARLRSRAAIGVWQETQPEAGRRAEANARLGRCGRRHARPAEQGRVERLPLFSRSRPGAGDGDSGGSGRGSRGRWASCRRRCASGWNRNSGCRTTMPTCW